MKSFNGEDCLKILEKLAFEIFFPIELYPTFQKKAIFNNLLRDFNEIFLNIKKITISKIKI